MTQKVVILLGVGLLVALLIGGFVIYKFKIQKLVQTKVKQPASLAENIKLLYPESTAEEQLLMIKAKQSLATLSATVENVALAEKAAKETGILEISNCLPNPIILKIKKDQEFQLKNTGVLEHKLIFHRKKQLIVKGGEQMALKLDFGNQTGFFFYNCDAFSKIGLIYIPKS